MNITITKPFVIAGAVILLLWGIGLSLCAISGNLMPLQSAKITQLGVCLTDESYTPVMVVPAGTSDLLICGYVSGATKKTSAFYIFRNDEVVAQTSGTVGPGPFFLSPLLWYEPLVAGTYRIDASSGKFTLLSSEFVVR